MSVFITDLKIYSISKKKGDVIPFLLQFWGWGEWKKAHFTNDFVLNI